jgi:DNA polymerase III delta prime subunit
MIKTELLGQEEALEICERALISPTHMFFFGSNGLGKTTLARDFIYTYATQHNVDPNDSELFLWLQSDVDRGIHTIRAKLADFTRGAPKVQGVLRWVIVDDADTLPEVSQQALRRPMEQYAHLTCFLFIAKNSECLIHALQSRCQPVRFVPIPLQLYFDTLLQRIDYKIDNMQVRNWLIASSFSSIAELKRFIQNLKYMVPENPSLKDAKDLCAAHNFSHLIPILQAINANKTHEVYWRLMKLWQDGMSFEDILHAIHLTMEIYFTLGSHIQEKLYTFLVTGWAYHAKSQCSFLDLLSCAYDAGLLNYSEDDNLKTNENENEVA